MRFPSLLFRVLLAFSSVSAAVQGAVDYSAPYACTTLAGESSIGNADGPGDTARFHLPADTVTSPDGTIHVADAKNHAIRKISPGGLVTTFVGKADDARMQDGPADTARFLRPGSVARDGTGNLYVVDSNTLRQITPAGVVTTLAGQAGVSRHTDGQGSQASFALATDVAVSPAGNLYVTDLLSSTIRQITPQGLVTTFAGQPGRAGADDGAVSTATFAYPSSIASDQTGALYVTDDNGVRRVSPAGVVTTLARGDLLNRMTDLTVDLTGNVFVVFKRSAIWKLLPDGSLTLFAGNPNATGSEDGGAGTATLTSPAGLSIDPAGNLHFAEPGDHTIRKVTPAGVVTTLAGLPLARSNGNTDGTGRTARFLGRFSATLGPAGDLWVASINAHTIRKITPAGVVTTIAGAAGQPGSADGPGPAARFNSPGALVFDRAGNLYVSDRDNYTIRRIAPDGTVSTLAGSAGLSGTADGSGANARFLGAAALTISPAGDLYTYEYGRVRRISPTGTVVTLPTSYDTYTFPNTLGLAFSPDGRLFLAGRFTLNEISPVDGSFIRLVAGDIEDRHRFDSDGNRYVFGDDGPRESAHFSEIGGLTFDQVGNAYLTDTANLTVRKVTPEGRATTLAGFAGPADAGQNHIDGVGSAARFTRPTSIVIDSSGTLYVADNSTLRKGQLASTPVISTQPLSQTVTAGGSVQFSVVSAAVPAPTYQWYVNGSPFRDATASTLSFTNARSTDAGDYTVVVTNPLGSVTSAKATLAVTAAPVPPPPGSPGSGGGGAPSPWFLLALGGLGWLRRFGLKRARRFF